MPLDPNRFTRKTAEALGAAQAAAREQGHTEVGSEHLLRALLAQPEGIVSGVLERIGVLPAPLAVRLDETLAERRGERRHGARGVARVGCIPRPGGRRHRTRANSTTSTSRPSTSCSR